MDMNMKKERHSSENFLSPGAIQPCGCLFAFGRRSLLLQRYSANAEDFLEGVSPQFGMTPSQCFGDQAAEKIMSAVWDSRRMGRPALIFDLPIGPAGPYDVSVHMVENDLVVECERSSGCPDHNGVLIAQMRMALEGLRDMPDLPTLFSTGTRRVRALMDYDRVLIVRFDRDWSAKIVGEDRRSGEESLLGQYFPRESYSEQVRALFRRTLVRVVGDAASAPVALVEIQGLAPLDLSFAQLRAVLPQYQDHLRARNASAAMIVSLVVDGGLWGLMACYNRTPRPVPMNERAVAKMIGEFVALQIAALIRSNRLQITGRAHALIEHFLHNSASTSDIPSYVRTHLSSLASLTDCDRIGVWVAGQWTSHGIIPSESAIALLRLVADEKASASIWTSESLLADMPALAALMPGIAGLMIVPISPQPNDYLFLFRRERIRVLNHGICTPPRSDPKIPHSVTIQHMGGYCAPWTIEDEEAAEQLRSALIEVMGAYHQQMLKERTEADIRQRILNEELNHRVKNILAVVQALVSRPPPAGYSPQEYFTGLRGRIAALATAHDQFARSESGGLLRNLLSAELAPYLSQAGVVRFDGPNVWITGKALSIMALLFHELATNAAKYGALSVPEGHLHISWAHQPANGVWDIVWTEHDGPVVVTPQRSGFGTVLLERAISHELGGTASREFLPEGVRIHIALADRFVQPLAATGHDGNLTPVATEIPEPPVPAPSPSPATVKTLEGSRVLLLEDQILIAMETEDALLECGVAEVHTAASAQMAREILATTTPDAAILDINLSGETSVEIARLLAGKNIPFVFATGYADHSLTMEEFGDVPTVRKPYSIQAITEALNRATLQAKGPA